MKIKNSRNDIYYFKRVLAKNGKYFYYFGKDSNDEIDVHPKFWEKYEIIESPRSKKPMIRKRKQRGLIAQ